mmetsp:Transcript_21148/g.39311  ORF Transcript_21148/g.39311 Transcript_21148/m.39311 type:complete len:285 (-) Transcript_21148:85-939(-)
MLSDTNDSFQVSLRTLSSPPGSAPVHLTVPANMTFKKFLKAASKKLRIKGTRCFIEKPVGEFTEVKFLDEVAHLSDLVITADGEDVSPLLDVATGQEELFISVVGAGGVGKSACTLRFARDFFVQDWDPTIEDAYRKTVVVDGRQTALELLDTAGQDDYESLRPSWMMEKQGYVFVYSVNSKQSLEELDLFYKLHKQINDTNAHKIPIILVANKKDITDLDPKKRQVSIAEGRKKAEAFGAIHIETSAATGENVNLVFETLVREVRKRKVPQKPPGLGVRCCIL